MVMMGPIQKIIKYVLASGRLKDERPLSALIIAPVECGKTSLIRRYCLRNENVFYVTDATAHGIIRDTRDLEEFRSGPLTHIVIPDLITCISRKANTVNTLISFLNAVIEEGVDRMSTYAARIGGTVEVKAGLITAMPPDVFRDKRHRWGKMGFLSRALPVSYDYKPSTKVEIFSSIQNQEHLNEKTVRLNLPERPKLIELPPELAKRIEPHATMLADAYSRYQKVYGFRYQKQLQTLVKSIALIKKKDEVDDECIRELIELSNYINFDLNKI